MKERNGLDCALCGANTSVLYTRRADGFIKRRRVCSNPRCGYTEVTHERPVGLPRRTPVSEIVPDMERTQEPAGNSPCTGAGAS